MRGKKIMAQVKLTENKNKYWAGKGKESIVFDTRSLVINSIDFKNDKRGDVAIITFMEELVCDRQSLSNSWTASFDAYANNEPALKSLNRGDTCNVELRLKTGEPMWQEINFISGAVEGNAVISEAVETHTPTQSVEPQEEVGIPEEPKVQEVSEDVHQQPEAEFRFPILYHDRRNLSIQRQKSIEFALQFLDNLAKHKLEPDGQINYTQFIEVSDFIWHGIQELWKDIPREVDNSEK
tara:strand:+ start:1774 stop:2487 length:714 start_codon:yes stop_codon:yes gene_type:complete